MAVVNDIIGLIRDSSGNGNNATQATAASKPILKQAANGVYYVGFDGVDDNFNIDPTAWNPSDTHFAAWTGPLIDEGRIIGLGNATTLIRTFVTASLNLQLSATTESGTVVTAEVSQGATPGAGQSIVFGRVSHDGVNTTVELRLLKPNGLDNKATAVGAGILSQPTPFTIGSYGPSYSPLNLYGFVLRGKGFTEWEQDKIIQLFRAKGAQV